MLELHPVDKDTNGTTNIVCNIDKVSMMMGAKV